MGEYYEPGRYRFGMTIETMVLLTVPYDSGHRGRRMGAGPLHLLESGAIARLEAAGKRVRHVPIELEDRFWTEVQAATRLQQMIAQEVHAATEDRVIVLSGNCNSSIGTTAGLAHREPGVIWLDAHPDLETPDTTTSGFYDGQALAILIGRCWRQMSQTVAGWRPVAPEHVILIGGREASDAERALIDESGVLWLREDDVVTENARIIRALDALRSRRESVYLHVDLDIHGVETLRANGHASAGGPTPASVRRLVRQVQDRFDVVAASITAFDPQCDRDGRATAAALALIEVLASSGDRDNAAPGGYR
jgi:arginase